MAKETGPSIKEQANYVPSLRRTRSLSRTYEAMDSMASMSSSFCTSDTVDSYRRSAKNSQDPAVMYKFALYLLASAEAVARQDNDEQSARLMKLPAGHPGSLKSLNDKDTKKRSSSAQALQIEALKHLKKLACTNIGLGKTPFPEAQFFLAEALSNGDYGLSVDHNRAFNLYLQASKQNHAKSAFKVAYSYEHGAGIKQDSVRSLQFYRKAASLGEPQAMHRLALILQRGQLGESKNAKEAMMWLHRAAQVATEAAYPRPIHDLAVAYEKTGGSPAVIPDESYAFELYSKAATMGLAASQYRLGVCYEYGHLDCHKNAEASITWYFKAAMQGHPEAQLALSGWYLTGADGVLEPDEAKAFVWADKSAKQGNAKALFAVGHYHETGTGTPTSLKNALDAYHKASLQGNRRATMRLNELKKLMKAGKLACPVGYKLESSACSIM